jgi:hypothetical protein
MLYVKCDPAKRSLETSNILNLCSGKCFCRYQTKYEVFVFHVLFNILFRGVSRFMHFTEYCADEEMKGNSKGRGMQPTRYAWSAMKLYSESHNGWEYSRKQRGVSWRTHVWKCSSKYSHLQCSADLTGMQREMCCFKIITHICGV